jgi:site-specific recombinase XerD
MLLYPYSNQKEKAIMTNNVQLPDLATLRKGFNRFITGPRGATEATLSAYNHDIDMYLEYLDSDPNTSSSFEINERTLRNYVTFLRERGNVSSTIQRRLNGVSAFWNFLYLEYSYSNPKSIKDCGIRLKNKRNPTQSISHAEYSFLIGIIYANLSKIK